MAEMPYHVIQRGNNREACFFSDSDYSFYLSSLKDACDRYHVSCHAYVLMTNHVHLLLTPKTDEGISKVMQSLGRSYVQQVNKQYKRCGTLWESRHKASLVDAEDYLISCYRYIELNPVTAGMVEHPADYQWSSYRHNAYGEENRLIRQHPLYLALSANRNSRLESYRQLFDTSLSKETVQQIRTAANFSMPLGNRHFKAKVERELSRRIGYAAIGRPQKASCEYE